MRTRRFLSNSASSWTTLPKPLSSHSNLVPFPIGPSRQRAVEVVRTAVGYAFGAALSELCWSCAAVAAETQLGRLRRISQMLPDDVPEDLLAVAMDVCGNCDLDGPFELGLDLMLNGLEPS
jgi:hypothetical protein